MCCALQKERITKRERMLWSADVASRQQQPVQCQCYSSTVCVEASDHMLWWCLEASSPWMNGWSTVTCIAYWQLQGDSKHIHHDNAGCPALLFAWNAFFESPVELLPWLFLTILCCINLPELIDRLTICEENRAESLRAGDPDQEASLSYANLYYRRVRLNSAVLYLYAPWNSTTGERERDLLITVIVPDHRWLCWTFRGRKHPVHALSNVVRTGSLQLGF